MELKDCFREDFTLWLVKSNHPKILNLFPSITLNEYTLMVVEVVEESLKEILDILLREPLADYFWYHYPEHGGKLFYSVPSDEPGPVPGNALRVDKEKMKIFLRDIKIENLLQ